MKQTSKGFTLIELLVVIAIIGILATIVITALSDARKKARDARRHQDIKQIQTALEVYYAEHGQYPYQANWGGVAPGQGANSGNSSWEALETMIGVSLPRDPVNDTPVTSTDWAAGPGRKFNYTYSSGGGFSALSGCSYGQAYILVYRLEKGDAPVSESPGVIRCTTGDIYRYGAGSITVGLTPLM